jgi:AraC-like DNA-binding protein
MQASWSRYLTPGPTHRRLGLVCLGVGTFAGKTAALAARTLDCYALVYVSRGRGWLESGGRRTALSGPALFWLLPGVEHAYAPEEPGWNEWWVLFDGDAAGAYHDLGYVARDELAMAVGDPDGLELAFSEVARAFRTDAVDTDVAAAAATHQLVVASRRCGASGWPADAPVLAALLRHACRPLTIAALARKLRLSEPELREITRRAAGCTPKEYVMRARLNRAKDLLATTDLSVAAVALRTGYDDPGYFTRLFTRRTGTSPSLFRQQQRQLLPADEPEYVDGEVPETTWRRRWQASAP